MCASQWLHCEFGMVSGYSIPPWLSGGHLTVDSLVGELECPLLLASRDEEELNLLLLLLLLKASFVELRERAS